MRHGAPVVKKETLNLFFLSDFKLFYQIWILIMREVLFHDWYLKLQVESKRYKLKKNT